MSVLRTMKVYYLFFNQYKSTMSNVTKAAKFVYIDNGTRSGKYEQKIVNTIALWKLANVPYIV